jgi:hypothetical protein
MMDSEFPDRVQHSAAAVRIDEAKETFLLAWRGR